MKKVEPFSLKEMRGLMHLLTWIATLLCLSIFWFSCEKKNEDLPAKQPEEPVLLSFAPTTGEVGTEVTINGIFPATASISVLINHTPALMKSRSTSQLVVTVSGLTLTGLIAVIVDSDTLLSEAPFMVKPRIASLTPLAGLVGTTVLISGSGFDPNSNVQFNGASAIITSISDLAISAVVPDIATTGPVSVSVDGLQGMSPDPFSVITSDAVASGGAGDQRGNAVASDNLGNTYVAGGFSNQLTIGGVTLNSSGDEDIFIVKYNSNFEVVWVLKAGGPGPDRVYSLTLDISGDVYIGGYTNHGATFGSLVSDSPNNWNSFVAKLSSGGIFVWLSDSLDSNSTFADDPDLISSICVDGSGNVYATGRFSGTVIFGGASPLVASSGVGNNIFIVRYNSIDGNVTLARSFAGAGAHEAASVVVDGTGNVFLAGWFTGNIILGTSTLTSANNSYFDSFVAKLNASGEPQWSRQLQGANGHDLITSITLGSGGKLYITGSVTGSASIAGQALPPYGLEDMVTARLDGNNGALEWAINGGGNKYDVGVGLVALADGSCYVVGYVEGNATFSGLYVDAITDVRATYLLKIDAAGKPKWALKIGSTGISQPGSISLSNSKFFVTGFITAKSKFVDKELTPEGQDLFLWRIGI